ncbi:serine/threonine-protein kinase ATM [Anopheles aquasalis]|uniref:serine/threonine-protein kinase ATM n=1 Tax=Anopheles aquasalis TaxID=42839 RepID=UPI00215B4435|nr:serine/threonine-protein kinase ATM [Anopheles aquasalis]
MSQTSNSTLSVLDRDVCMLLVEMRSDKVTVRQKAVSRMLMIANGRTEEFSSYIDSEQFETGWNDVFDATYHSILKQAHSTSATVKGKNDDYVVLIHKIAECAMLGDAARLTFQQLIDYALQGLEDDAIRTHFGLCFVQLIQKHVLGVKWDLTTISYEHWRSLIDKCFVLLDDVQLGKQVLQCLSLAIRKFLGNCSKTTFLANYFPRLMEQIRHTEKNKSMHELIGIALHVVQAVAVDGRVKAQTFVSSLKPYLVKAYEVKMADEQKIVLFRLMHLSLILDSPGGNLRPVQDDRLTDELPAPSIVPQERSKQLRQLFSIVSAELKELLSRSYAPKYTTPEREMKFVDGFLDFAARLCYTIYWDENGCVVNEESGESSSKRAKKCRKLQSLMDFANTTSSPNNMCWLIILSLLLERHCMEPLQPEDFQPLLQQLSELQPAVQSVEQHRAFYRCCEALLQYEETRMIRSSMGDAQFCGDLWSMILKAACRSSSSTSLAIAEESCRLMQLLIRYRKYPSIDLLHDTILEGFYSNAIKKTNASASCLQSILEKLSGIDCLSGGKDEVLKKMFDYLYLGPGKEKEIIHGKIRLNTKLLANISVLAVVTKHVGNEPQIDDHHLLCSGLLTEEYVEGDRHLRLLERRLLLQNVDQLIMSEEAEQEIEAGPLVTYNVNEALFDRLCSYLNFDKNVLPEEDKMVNAPLLEDMCYDLELYMQIFNILMHHQAHTNEQFRRLPVIKKVLLKLQLLNMGFQRLLEHDPSFCTNEATIIGERLLAIFRGPYHPAVAIVLQAADISSILKWCRNHIDLEPHDDSEHVERITLDQLPTGQHVHRCYLHTMIHYLQYEGAVLAADVHDMLEHLELNVYSSLDVFYIFDLCRILLRHPSNEIVADWVLKHLISVCKVHHTNAGITEEIIDLYADLVRFVSPYESMIKNVTIVLNSFVKKCKQHIYSAELQGKIIAQIKHLLRAYPLDFEQPMHEQLYTGLVPLLNSSCYCIKMEVVRNFLHIFHSAWVYGKDAQVSRSYYNFLTMLYELVDFEVISSINDLDERTNAVSGLLQLLLATFRVCYELRRRSLQDFILLTLHGKLRDAKVATLIRHVSVVSRIEIVKVAQTNIDGLLDVWLAKDYSLKDFPCRLTGASGSIENFVQMHRKGIAFAMLCMHPDRFQSFCQSVIGVEYEAMTKLILPRSLAFLLPWLAKCAELAPKYETIANQVQKALTPFLRKMDLKSQLFDVMKHLIYRMKDANELEKLLEQEIAWYKDDYQSVSYIHYSQSMVYLRQQILKADGTTATVPLLSYLCQDSRQSLVERLLSHVKRWLWGSEEMQQKVIHLLQYVTVVEQLREYIDQQSNGSFAKYLVREVIYFLGNLLSTVPRLRLAIVNCFERVLKLFSAKAHAILSIHLHFIASSLLEVEVLDSASKLSGNCLALLRFLIVDQSELYPEAIAKLNYFPADDRFAELRTVIELHKTQGHGSAVCSLKDEIVGLLELPYLRYEDLAALRLVIINKCNELNDLCKEIGSSGDESVLHPLVFKLLDVVRSSSFDKKSIEAMRCLGELGPLDLKSMQLKSDVESIVYETIDTFDNAVERCAEIILTELDEMLTSKNVTVGRNASLAAYELLHGKTFHSAVAKLPTMSIFRGQSTAEVSLFSYCEGSVPQLTSSLVKKCIGYHSFVEQVCTILLKFLRNEMLKVLVVYDQGFAEKLVPLLIQASLKLCKDAVNKEIGRFINNFFAMFTVNGQDGYVLFNDSKSIQLMLTVVECVRINNEIFPQFRINLDYLKIANAARYCQAHFKSIIYCELWHHSLDKKRSAENDRQLMEIMRSSHIAIGVNDAVKEFLNPRTERTEYYQLEQKYNRALVFRDASGSLINPGDIGVDRSITLQLLKDSSLYGLARYFNQNEKEIDYECAWRLADWSAAIDISENADPSIVQCGPAVADKLFERSHYKALKSLTLKDELAAESAISEARRAIAELLKHTSTESMKHIYTTLCRLRQLGQIEDFGEILFQKQIDCEQDLLDKWNQQDSLPYSEFELQEQILSQRWSILQTTVGRTQQNWLLGAMCNTLLLLIHESRSRGLHDCALRNLALIETVHLPANAQAIVLLEDAQLNWGMGNHKLACDRAMDVLENKQYCDKMVNAVALRLHGQFQAESDSKELVTLRSDFFDKSLLFVRQLKSQGDWSAQKVVQSMVPYSHRCFESDRNFTVVHTVAKYADREFVRLSKYCKSQEWRMRRDNINKMENELEQLKLEATKAADKEQRDMRRLAALMQKNMQRDKKEVERVEQDRRNYLLMALQYYIDYSGQSTIESDFVIFRIIALWLNNLHEAGVQQMMNDRIQAIPSFKFVPVLPQLAPRLSTKSSVGAIVHSTLVRCTLAHPHHTLPYVFAQLHAFKDQSGIDVSRDDRLMGAKKLYGDLLKLSDVRPIIEQMDRMNQALIELANKNVSGSASFQQYNMTSKDKLRSLKDLESIHCPTVGLRVSETGDYKNAIIGIVKWEQTIIGVGGINAPKKLKCLCADGKVRTQLLKGKDDMRQDAVMQQVFGIINVLLRHDKETARRQLSIRTYKVVPLSRQSGILEWCENTIPIGVWMVSGHKKYRPQDYDPSEARKRFQENAQPGKTFDDKLNNYRSICKRLQPVFRYYFLEHYLKPGDWFARRQKYVKSVATSSMIGYILGIGDRHVQNILIDKRTAEVIHIDFGIAFELGKNLPTPETVPFRLTRDLVDGMGMTGVEGVFKKSCEKTMEVLRSNQAPIITILEVLLHDPLYSWNVLSNKRANQRQLQDSQPDSTGCNEMRYVQQTSDVNVTAERALMLVTKKLEGMEDDKYISIEGQVQKLIFAATNDRNLCQLFHGFQPYL